MDLREWVKGAKEGKLGWGVDRNYPMIRELEKLSVER
jgi:hypothetical protein